jgi:hypothetical protein
MDKVAELAGAIGFAERTTDARLRVDHEKMRTLVEAVDRTDLHTVGVLALDVALGDHEGHFSHPWGDGIERAPGDCQPSAT